MRIQGSAWVALAIGHGVVIAPAAGQAWFRFTVDQPASGVELTVDTGTSLEGTFIGNYDPQANPGGTQTRPGLFGGSGNQPIPMTAELLATGEPQSSASGGFEMDVDLGANALVVRGLTLDMLAGGPLAIDFVVSLGFQTFRTFNPNSLFLGVPGGIPIPVGGAEVSALSGAQPTAGVGVLTPAGPGEYTFAALIPLEVTGEVSALGQVFALPPTVLPVPLAGTLRLPGGGRPASVVMEFEGEVEQSLPPPPLGLENFPLDLPTILPPGGTAHLLVNAEFGEVRVGTGLRVVVAAEGTAYCRPDFDLDGVLTVFDYLDFQNAWVRQEARGDYLNDGAYDMYDFLLFQNDFDSGCE